MNIPSRAIRLACNLAKPDLVLDARTNLPPVVVRGAAVRFQVGLFVHGTIVDDVENFDTATLKVRALSDAGVIGAVQVSKALADAAIGNITATNWTNGSAQHAEFAATGTEMNLAAGTYWLIVAGQTIDGAQVVWAACKLALVDHGLTDDTVQAPEFLPSNGPTCKRGSVDLGVGDEAKAITFATAFASAPSVVLLTMVVPAGQPGVRSDVRGGYGADGFTVDLRAPIPATGYKLTWLAIL